MIPKVLHIIWFSGDEKPQKIKDCMATWGKVMPDYQIKEWSLKDVEHLRKQPGNQYLDQALTAKKWSYAADFLRLWILHTEGGIYLDSDVQILKPFDTFLHHGFFTCYERNKSVEAAVMGAQPGNRFALEFLELYKNKNFQLEDGTFEMEIIPRTIADCIVKQHGKKYKARSRHTIIDDLHIYPWQYFSPKNGWTGKIRTNKNTHAIHHFANMHINLKEQNPSLMAKIRWSIIKGTLRCSENVLSYKRNRKVRAGITSFVENHAAKKKAKREKKNAKRTAKETSA
jgi:mannosyltransferase OCH1-like enzyme